MMRWQRINYLRRFNMFECSGIRFRVCVGVWAFREAVGGHPRSRGPARPKAAESAREAEGVSTPESGVMWWHRISYEGLTCSSAVSFVSVRGV